ncbi:hypothetical protein J1N35_040017 [Gossypium stocksii]|uniref:rRNA methyltransferase 2, mitochondrial n=1 Tax=Gossypium stocksii TaxID=47602 RepID=A0A9D3UDE0_9ROSI|nr:hypothetical protein J1N35_040017 [Gossypium stocksii]
MRSFFVRCTRIESQKFVFPRDHRLRSGLIRPAYQKPPLHCDARVQTISADVMKLSKPQVMELSPKKKGFSVILSDMCPSVSGISTRDAALSFELGMRALDLAVGRAMNASNDNFQNEGKSCTCSPYDKGVLLSRGHLVIKLLESEDTKGEISPMLL